MSGHAFPSPPQVTLPIVDSELRFPVRRIYCVGRNYRDHVKEMGGSPDRDPPFFFGKPADALVENGSVIPYPSLTHDLHHEVELVVAIGASTQIFGYAVGFDFTRRDLQAHAKKHGLPWDFAKGFDRSAPCSAIHPNIGVLDRGRIWLSVDDQVRQDANVSELVWSIPELIAKLKEGVELRAGDLIFTGTPGGVGPLVSGNRVRGGVEGVGELEIKIA